MLPLVAEMTIHEEPACSSRSSLLIDLYKRPLSHDFAPPATRLVRSRSSLGFVETAEPPLPLPLWFIASKPALLPSLCLSEAFELWRVVFVKKFFHLIWLSAMQGQLCRASFALWLSIYLTWEENYDFVNSCMSVFSIAHTSMIHLETFIFYWYYFQVTIHNVVILPCVNLDGGRQWAHYLALW